MRVFGWLKPWCAMKVISGRNPSNGALSTDLVIDLE